MSTIVEARGVLCPVPIIRLARTAARLPAGTLVELLSDDPAAEHDVPAWCRLRGHELLSTEPLPGPNPPKPLSSFHGPEGALSDETAAGAAGDGVAPGTVDSRREPRAPNPSPGQGLRHVIRLGGTPADPEPARPDSPTTPSGPAPAG